jgi:hypothetical protein
VNYWEVNHVKNLNESREKDTQITTADVTAKGGSEAEVVPFQGARKVNAEAIETLLPESEAQGFQSRWNTIQTNFVDEPRKAVEDADKLVADGIQRLAQVFSEERSNLDNQWRRGEQVSTEDLRIAFQRYRAFFLRLLSI